MRKEISRLHFLTQDLKNKTHSSLANIACAAGINWLQFRMKNESNTLMRQAVECKRICEAYNATFIVNDFVDVAIRCGADGVHVGKEDIPVKNVRRILNDDFIIGTSSNTLDDVLKAIDDGADYSGIGPFRFTSTKKNLNPIIGLKGLEKVMNELSKRNIQFPLIAIGGIQLIDVKDILNLGVHGIAVSSALNLSKSFDETVKQFLKACHIHSSHKTIIA